MVLYVIIGILCFGLLIALHELGHFMTAKWLGVRVNEFSIGMGPSLWSTVRGETRYSIRWLPIGGYCAMEGEDVATDDPKSFENKPAWKKLIILLAGSAMNFLTGVVILFALSVGMDSYQVDAVAYIQPEADHIAAVLQVGDQIVSVDGHKVLTRGDAITLFGKAGNVVDLVVMRDGAEVTLPQIDMTPYASEMDGKPVMLRGFSIGGAEIEATLMSRITQPVLRAVAYVRVVWDGVVDLIRGAVGVEDMSGALGIIQIMGEAGEAGADAAVAAGTSAVMGALLNILAIVAFIAVNLAVMNLLPIPALDGGRILFLAVGGIFTLVTGRKLNPKYEGYVNMVAFFLLLGLMAFLALNDVTKLIG